MPAPDSGTPGGTPVYYPYYGVIVPSEEEEPEGELEVEIIDYNIDILPVFDF